MPSCAACAALHAASRVRRPGCVTRLRNSVNLDSAELAERTVTYAGAPEVRSKWRLQSSRVPGASVAAVAADVLAAGVSAAIRHRAHAAKRAARVHAGHRGRSRACHGTQAPSRAARLSSHALDETQVDEECTSCGHRGLSFHTMQARPCRLACNAFPHSRSCLAARAATLGGRGANRVLRVPLVQAQVVCPHVNKRRQLDARAFLCCCECKHRVTVIVACVRDFHATVCRNAVESEARLALTVETGRCPCCR